METHTPRKRHQQRMETAFKNEKVVVIEDLRSERAESTIRWPGGIGSIWIHWRGERDSLAVRKARLTREIKEREKELGDYVAKAQAVIEDLKRERTEMESK